MTAGSAYRIFLSYRRSDAGGYAGWLHQLLVEQFSDGAVFRDVTSLKGGERWADQLDETLARCNVVLAVIGPEWLTVTNEKGRRLDDPEDRVRLELEAGLRRGVPLIPALVGGARMPARDQLPPSLQPLCDWQAVRLSDESWQDDLQNLVDAIDRALAVPAGELQLGATFAGHQIEALIGRGGMGVVYRARHLGLDRVDAVKVIAPDLARSAEFRERFIRESRIAASVRHENVLTVYDAGEQAGLLYLTMQVVDGYDLATLIDREAPFAPGRAAAILAAVAAALDAAHDHGLVHRDVKPANILIENHRGKERIYLADFGLARETTTATGLTSTGRWIGTADYVSPEQVMGEEVDGRADVYSVGCILYQMLCGQVPYPSRSETAKLVARVTTDPSPLAELRPGLPAVFDKLVRTAMARNPDERYPSAAGLHEALCTAEDKDQRDAEAAAKQNADREAARDAEMVAKQAAEPERAERDAEEDATRAAAWEQDERDADEAARRTPERKQRGQGGMATSERPPRGVEGTREASRGPAPPSDDGMTVPELIPTAEDSDDGARQEHDTPKLDRRRRSKRLPLAVASAAVVAVAAAVVVAAASSGGGGNTVSRIPVSALPSGQLNYSTTTLTAASSHVTIDFTNESPIGHNVTIANAAGKVLGATPTFSGGTKTLTLSLQPGTYTFYCSVPGHEQAGMKGTLTVN